MNTDDRVLFCKYLDGNLDWTLIKDVIRNMPEYEREDFYTDYIAELAVCKMMKEPLTAELHRKERICRYIEELKKNAKPPQTSAGCSGQQQAEGMTNEQSEVLNNFMPFFCDLAADKTIVRGKPLLKMSNDGWEFATNALAGFVGKTIAPYVGGNGHKFIGLLTNKKNKCCSVAISKTPYPQGADKVEAYFERFKKTKHKILITER